MPVDLVGALVGWLVSLTGNAGIRLMRKSPDERALSKAVALAINMVVKQADSSSQDALCVGLRDCFLAPPRLGLDASTPVSDGLRAAIAAQVAQLDQMVHSDTGQPFYQSVPVDRVWLIDQVTGAVLTALRQVAAASQLAELVHAVDAADVLGRLDRLGMQVSTLQRTLVRPNHSGVSDVASWRGPVWAAPHLRGDEVARPGLMEELVAAVTRQTAGAAGTTTGLWGAGGFGKTTMARLLIHRPEVKEQFPDGVVWVTLGEDTAGPELADKVTNVVGLVCSTRPPLTDPLAAGAELGRAFGERRVLLVIDDVWTSAQVEPFLVGGSGAVRLFITRIQGVLPRWAERVRVDEMDRYEAIQVLTAGVGEVSDGLVEGLLVATGRWPVLLTLVNRAVRADLNAGRRAEESLREILHELRTTGPTALDVTDADERDTAIARTIGVSLARLTAEQRARYLELAVFGEDVAIPGPVLVRYWRTTGGWSEFQTLQYCQRLAELALVRDYRREPVQVTLHDVFRAYLREQTKHRRSELNRALVDAHRYLVAGAGAMSAWWQLPPEQIYLWVQLPTHLRDAGLEQELQACLHHLGWLDGKLEHAGPAALEADLTLSDDPISGALAMVVRQNAHVLGPLGPPGSLAATLASRLPGEGPTTAIAEEWAAQLTTPHLWAITTLPDLPHSALLRVLAGHTGSVWALVVAPDGAWMASAGEDGAVRIWDPRTGAARHVLTGHTETVWALVVAPDGSWLASGDLGGVVRIWIPATGTARYTLAAHIGGVMAFAVVSDGAWMASAGEDGAVRIWDPRTGAARHVLTGHTETVWALVVAPDGSWLASGDSGGVVRIWDAATGATLHTLTGHTGSVTEVVVAPDGSWLASAGHDGVVRIWDAATGATLHTLTGHTGSVTEVVVAPDGSWLASAGHDGVVRIWDAATGAARHTLTGHARRPTELVVAPDGSWLASAGDDGVVRIWDLATGGALHTLTGHTDKVSALVVAPDKSWLASSSWDGRVSVWDPFRWIADHIPTGRTDEVSALVVAPDGSYLASGDSDGGVRICDAASGATRHTLTGHTGRASEMAVAPGGLWLASAGKDGVVRIWDPGAGVARHTLTGHTEEVSALVVAPDGSWLASGDFGGAVRIWNPATGAARHTLIGHSWVFSLAASADGSWLASAHYYGQVRIWNPVTGAACHTLTGHTDTVWALTFAPDGSWLASAGHDGQVQIWDPATGAARHTLSGHTDAVWVLAVSPDGSWLASAGRDGQVRIWNPATGAACHTLTGHTDWVQALAVAPDGSWLASAGRDGQVRIWNPTTGASVTSLRVADQLSHLLPVSATIAAAGKRGLYFLALRGSNPDRRHDRSKDGA